MVPLITQSEIAVYVTTIFVDIKVNSLTYLGKEYYGSSQRGSNYNTVISQYISQ